MGGGAGGGTASVATGTWTTCPADGGTCAAPCTATNPPSATNCLSIGGKWVMGVTGACNGGAAGFVVKLAGGKPTGAATQPIKNNNTATQNDAQMSYIGTTSGEAQTGTMNISLVGTSPTASFTNLAIGTTGSLLVTGTISCP